jgi:hypothetical protein
MGAVEVLAAVVQVVVGKLDNELIIKGLAKVHSQQRRDIHKTLIISKLQKKSFLEILKN